MNHTQVVRIKKLTGKAIVQIAAKHNHREILAEIGTPTDGHIDASKIGENIILRGLTTASDVAHTAQSLMDEAGVKTMRKDAVRALEIIFSLPYGSAIDEKRFFETSVRWTEQYFEVPVISAIIHNDEAAPHCHALLLPLMNGRMVGSRLMGDRKRLQAMQTDFHSNVGQAYGLTRQAPQKRHSTVVRRLAIESACEVLEANSGLENELIRFLLSAHENRLDPLMARLGLTMPIPPLKKRDTFVKIMTKPCQPDKPIGAGIKKPIGFDDFASTKKEQSLSCVGFANSDASILPANGHVASPTYDDTKMVEQEVERYFDTVTERMIQAEQRAISRIGSYSSDDSKIENGLQTAAARITTKQSEKCDDDPPTTTRGTSTAPEPVEDDDDYDRHQDTDDDARFWDEITGEFVRPTIKMSSKQRVIHAVGIALKSTGTLRNEPPKSMRGQLQVARDATRDGITNDVWIA